MRPEIRSPNTGPVAIGAVKTTTAGPFGRLLEYRDCLRVLTARALKVRYRRSVLGFGWSLLYPLLSMLILTAVFSRVFPTVTAYPVYVIVGVLVWGFVSLSCLQAMDSLIGAAAVLRRVYVPPAVFPLSVVSANLVHFLLSILVLPVVMGVLGAWPGWHPLLLGAALVCLAAFVTGLALTLAACNLFFRDVRYFFEALLLLWFYATPVVYPTDVISGRLRLLLWANPLHWLLAVVRGALYPGAGVGPAELTLAPLVAAVCLGTGWIVFSRAQKRFYLYW